MSESFVSCDSFLAPIQADPRDGAARKVSIDPDILRNRLGVGDRGAQATPAGVRRSMRPTHAGAEATDRKVVSIVRQPPYRPGKAAGRRPPAFVDSHAHQAELHRGTDETGMSLSRLAMGTSALSISQVSYPGVKVAYSDQCAASTVGVVENVLAMVPNANGYHASVPDVRSTRKCR